MNTNFKKIIISIILTVAISTTTIFAQINNTTMQIISSEKENVVSRGYEISNQFKIFINDSQVTLNNGTLILNGRSYLPIRELSNFLGANVDYDANYKTAILSKNNTVIEIPQNRTKATVLKGNIATILNIDNNDNMVQSLVLNGVTYLPLRFIAENLGYDVAYNSQSKIIELNIQHLQNNPTTTQPIVENSIETTTQATQLIQTTTAKVEVKTLFVGNNNNFKLHYLDCRAAKKLLPEHRVPFISKEEALAAGYTDLCGICFK